MKTTDTAKVMRDLDVALSLFQTLQYTLEHNVGVRDYHYLSCLAGEGRRKLDAVVDVLSDRL